MQKPNLSFLFIHFVKAIKKKKMENKVNSSIVHEKISQVLNIEQSSYSMNDPSTDWTCLDSLFHNPAKPSYLNEIWKD